MSLAIDENKRLLSIELNVEIPEGMAVVDFKQLLSYMVHELIAKYPYYGNSWLTKNAEFWTERFKVEADEYNNVPEGISRFRKAVNIGNLALMAAHVEAHKITEANK